MANRVAYPIFQYYQFANNPSQVTFLDENDDIELQVRCTNGTTDILVTALNGILRQ